MVGGNNKQSVIFNRGSGQMQSKPASNSISYRKPKLVAAESIRNINKNGVRTVRASAVAQDSIIKASETHMFDKFDSKNILSSSDHHQNSTQA